MTPAVTAARKAGIPFELHRYEHDARAQSYGLEAAEALGLAPEQVFKTLMAVVDGQTLSVAIVPVEKRLDLKALAALGGGRKAAMCDPARAEKATGYVVGGISPLGQRKAHPTFLDESALGFATIHVSAGRRGLEIELSPDDLLALCRGKAGPIATA